MGWTKPHRPSIWTSFLGTLHAAGFEPAMSLRITDYESVAFDHSAMHAVMRHPRSSHDVVVLICAPCFTKGDGRPSPLVKQGRES